MSAILPFVSLCIRKCRSSQGRVKPWSVYVLFAKWAFSSFLFQSKHFQNEKYDVITLLVHVAAINYIPHWVAYKHRYLFLTVLEAWSPKSRCQHGLIPVRGLFLGHSLCLLTVPYRVEGVRDLWEVSFIRKLISFFF